MAFEELPWAIPLIVSVLDHLKENMIFFTGFISENPSKFEKDLCHRGKCTITLVYVMGGED